MQVWPPPARVEVADDREIIKEGDAVLLIVEDDPHYARVLLGLARDKGIKGLVAMRGNLALSMARQFKPTAITLNNNYLKTRENPNNSRTIISSKTDYLMNTKTM